MEFNFLLPHLHFSGRKLKDKAKVLVETILNFRRVKNNGRIDYLHRKFWPNQLIKGVFTWIRIEFQSKCRNIDSKSYKLGSKFHSWMKLGMKSTFIMAEIKIVCKMGSFIHVYMCIRAKIFRKIRLSGWDFHSPWSFNLNSIPHVNTNWVWIVVRDWTEICLWELTLSRTLNPNPKSSRSVDPQFSHKLLFYVH